PFSTESECSSLTSNVEPFSFAYSLASSKDNPVRRINVNVSGPLLTSKITFVSAGTTSSPSFGSVCEIISPSRSEEHTSELQSRFDLVCRLMLAIQIYFLKKYTQ